MKEFSSSKKRATLMFNLPDDCRYTVQEAQGKPDKHLRRALEKARDVFFAEWNKPRSKEEQTCPIATKDQ